MMNETLFMILAFIAGLVLGIFFFGGLWFTAKTPSIWFFLSFFLRVSIVMFGFYYISPGGLQPLIVSVLGFIVARFVVTHFTKSIDKKITKREVYHEACLLYTS